MTSCTGSARGGFWKSQLVELNSASGEDGWLSLARGGLTQVSYEMGGRWKSQNRKNVYLSPYVEEPLNSKVIKRFVPELRSRKCFCVSRFLCSMYICYEHSMYISRSHIHIWLWYNCLRIVKRLQVLLFNSNNIIWY